MLLELRIRNYAVIEELSLRLEPGLNALTGETGAGKSIVVGALSLVLGERASGEVIRAGEERAVIEAVFDIGGRDDLVHRCEEAGIDVEDGCLVLKRELNAGGRSRGWINGSPATAALMGELGGALVDIHGQHEHQALLHAGPQREILDAYAGATTLAEEVRACWIELSEARRRVAEIEERRARTEERAELLRHQVDEIEAAALASPDEDLTLGEEERLLSHAEELLERSSDLHDETYAAEASIYDRLGRVRRALDALGKVDPQGVEALSELHDTAYYAVQELGERLGRYRDAIEQDPASLERVRARIDLLFRLKSRYGPTLEGVIETGRRAREELEALDAAQFELEAASGRAEELANRLGKLAARLSEARREAAEALGSEVTSLLPELGMPDGRFELRLASRTTVASTGSEEIEFQVTLNRGFEPRPLSKVASGGELSRVMLALKTILAKLDRTATLIFDEIDAGIGGVVGLKVAERLKSVAEHHQVFVITHLPQIAALADHHLLVTKTARQRKAAAQVSELSEGERVRDIARMLGGDPEREESIEHARALLGLGDPMSNGGSEAPAT